MRCDDLEAGFASITFSSFRTDSSFRLIIPEVNQPRVVGLRCEVGLMEASACGAAVRELLHRDPRSRASTKPGVCCKSCGALGGAGLSTRASDSLGKIAGCIKKAYE